MNKRNGQAKNGAADPLQTQIDQKRPLPAEAFLEESTYRATRLPISFASTLIPDAYTSADFFAAEQERVFSSSWVTIGFAAEIKNVGDIIVRKVAGQSIIVTKSTSGELRAFFNVCRHRGAELVAEDRESSGRYIKCPYHAWAFDLDGKCIGTPLFTPDSEVPEDQRAAFDMSEVQAFDKKNYGLLEVALTTFAGLILVNLAPEPAPFEEEIGDLGERLDLYQLDEWDVAATLDYDIASNWKLIAENYMEFYHIPWVHPGLAKVAPIDGHFWWQGPGKYLGFGSRPLQPVEDSVISDLPNYSKLTGDNLVTGRYVWLFPNASLTILPNHVFVIICFPEEAGRTRELCAVLVRPEATELDNYDDIVKELGGFWSEVNDEDVEIVEAVQHGISNRAYPGGRMCYRFEELVHRFQNMVVDGMVGLNRVPEGHPNDEEPIFAPSPESAEIASA